MEGGERRKRETKLEERQPELQERGGSGREPRVAAAVVQS